MANANAVLFYELTQVTIADRKPGRSNCGRSLNLTRGRMLWHVLKPGMF